MQRSRISSVLKFGLFGLVSLGLSFSGWGKGTNPASAYQLAGGVYKVIASPGEIDLAQPGVTLWHDYGAFALYRVTESAYTALSAESGLDADITSEMDQLTIGNRRFDTQRDSLQIPPGLQAVVDEGKALQLIQFVGPVKAEWLELVQAGGSELVHYVANNGYLVWSGPEERSRLGSLAQEKDILQFSAPLGPYFKLGESVLKRMIDPADADEIVRVTVQMYRHPDKANSEAIIQKLALEQLSPWSSILAFQNTTITLRAGDLEQIAGLPDVFWIGERFDPQLFDEVQNQILAGNLNGDLSGPSGIGYLPWLNSLGFSQDPDDYPVIDITDDGIGNGSLNSGDPTLHEFGSISNQTRLAFLQSCNFSTTSGGGPDGHGHLNASIAGGYDVRAGSPYRDPNGFQRGMGVNPYGQLAGTRIFAPGYNNFRCGGTDSGVIQASYQAGARITSNSWGCGTNFPPCVNTYDESAQAYDVGVRDALPGSAGNQEFIILFAAGNDGNDGAMSIGSPGNAKNVITVGASENYRPTWTDGCNVGASGANDAMDLASFSSRGPAPGERVKPEVIAPGTHIQGTASTYPSYTGFGVCDKYRPEGQTVFAASSGTSHSTPAVAGVASLYYYWLENIYGIPAPSPAIVKAYLIAHPTYLSGVSANDTLPSNNQGYGMPDMETAFDNTDRILLDQTSVLNNTGETWTFSGEVADPGKPVRIVLAYTDQAGAIGTSPQVNNLNLSALVNGAFYLGNHFSGGWSIGGGSPDTKNNYEAIFLPPGTTGSIQLTVTAFNLPGDGVPAFGDGTDQDFALVCYNCEENTDYKAGITPTVQTHFGLPQSSAVYTYTVTNKGQFMDTFALSVAGLWPVNLSKNHTVELNAGGSEQVMLTVTIPASLSEGASDIATLTVTSDSDTNQKAYAIAETRVVLLKHYLPIIQKE